MSCCLHSARQHQAGTNPVRMRARPPTIRRIGHSVVNPRLKRNTSARTVSSVPPTAAPASAARQPPLLAIAVPRSNETPESRDEDEDRPPVEGDLNAGILQEEHDAQQDQNDSPDEGGAAGVTVPAFTTLLPAGFAFGMPALAPFIAAQGRRAGGRAALGFRGLRLFGHWVSFLHEEITELRTRTLRAGSGTAAEAFRWFLPKSNTSGPGQSCPRPSGRR